MNAKEQILSLIKAQDIVRKVYVQHDGSKAEMILQQLDKNMTKTINLLGDMFERFLNNENI